LHTREKGSTGIGVGSKPAVCIVYAEKRRRIMEMNKPNRLQTHGLAQGHWERLDVGRCGAFRKVRPRTPTFS